jgi:hypothetical protein
LYFGGGELDRVGGCIDVAAFPSATAISRKLPPALAGSLNCALASSSSKVSAGEPAIRICALSVKCSP